MKTSVLLVDNYDSFTYNLKSLIASQCPQVRVLWNDDPDLLDLDNFTHLILSPGPKGPEDSGYCPDLVRKWAGRKPVLGVCLGQQIIASCFGGETIKAPYPYHGKTSIIQHSGDTLFRGLPQELRVARYHSLMVDPGSLGDGFQVDASCDRIVMALSHDRYPCLHGVQFHPESFLSAGGAQIMENFLKMTCETL